MSGKFIAYYRVSTQRQGASGLGLAAQRQAVADYLRATGGELVGDFEEVESGKNDERPELTHALERCRLTGARLLIAKLDRLSRNVAFLARLMDQGAQFVACDMPEANELTIHIMAAVAQAERKAISARTKAALGAINARLEAGDEYVSKRSGRVVAKLGNPHGLSAPRPDLGVEAIKAKADKFAGQVGPIVRGLRDEGLSFAAIAGRLSGMHVKTQRGGAWTAMGVKRVLERAV
ncbi:MAG: recombinase family protein [Asticcacaulis sp.]|uniref:recombinase family protein n=1 Tax=Asticcacaulis sp. TaxID=1872648 RepID=UPI003F7C1A11